MWASDPAWANPGDGGAVASWRNGGSVGGNPTQAVAAAKPTFRASVAALNGRAAVEFDGGDGLDVDVADIAQPFKVVAVIKAGGLGVARGFLGLVASGERCGVTSTDLWIANASAALTGGAVNTNGHVYRATYNSPTNSQLVLDETVLATGDAGPNGLQRFQPGTNGAGTAQWLGHIAFIGVYAGTVADASLTTVARGLGRFYGISVA